MSNETDWSSMLSNESKEKYKDKEWLFEQLENKSKNQIANECDVSWNTIDNWQTKFKEEDASWKDEENLHDMYVKEEMSASEIGDKYNVQRNKVLKRIKELNIETRGKEESLKIAHQKNRGNINTDVSTELNQHTSYIYGVLLSDGYVHQGTYGIKLEVVSKEFAESFYESLVDVNLNPTLKEKSSTYSVRAHSSLFVKEFYNQRSIREVPKWNEDKVVNFIKGVYESEGSYTLSGSGSKQIDISITDKEFYNTIKSCLDIICIEYSSSESQRRTTFDGKQYDIDVYSIRLYKDVDKFLDLVKPCIKNQPSNSSSAGSI